MAQPCAVAKRRHLHDVMALAELKAGTGFDGVEKFLLQQGAVVDFRQLEQVHAGARCRQALWIFAGVMNAEWREQVLAKQTVDNVHQHVILV